VYSYEVERIVPQGKRQTVVLLVLKSDTGVIRRHELLTADNWAPDSLMQADLEAHWMAGTEADVAPSCGHVSAVIMTGRWALCVSPFARCWRAAMLIRRWQS